MPLNVDQIEEIAVQAAISATKASMDQAAELAAEKAVQKTINRKEVSSLVEEAVKQTLLQLGIDSQNPLEMQRDFLHLRQWRRAGEDIKKQSTVVVIGIFITGLVSLLVLGIKAWIGK